MRNVYNPLNNRTTFIDPFSSINLIGTTFRLQGQTGLTIRPLSIPSTRYQQQQQQTYPCISVHPPSFTNPNFPTTNKRKEVPVKDILKKARRGDRDRGGIHVRDLLALNIQTSKDDAVLSGGGDHLILPRGGAVLVKLGHIKAIAWRDCAYLFDPHRPDVMLFSSTLQSSLVQLPAARASGEEHFELFFLEEVLREVCDTWDRRIKLYRPVVDKVIKGVGDGTDGNGGIHRLVPLKDSLMDFQLHVESLLNTLNTLLENDDDMLGLLLTEKWIAKKEGKEVDVRSHEVVELLLEDYSRQLHSVLGSITALLARVQTAQDHYAIKLSTYRNDMIRMNVRLSIATVGMGFATMVAGFFGMNLTHGMEDAPGVFVPTVAGSLAIGGVIYLGCQSHLSGDAALHRGKMRAMEVQSVTGVLRDMNSLDYAVKKLNKLPEVRRFVKNVDEEHVSLYAPDVVVEWKSHKPPVLIVYDDDVELETIPLDKFMTNDLHVLMAKHGFKKSGAEAVEVEEKKEGCEDDGEGSCKASY